MFTLLSAIGAVYFSWMYADSLVVDPDSCTPMMVLYAVFAACLLAAGVLSMLFGFGKVSGLFPAAGLAVSFLVYLSLQLVFFFSPWGGHTMSIFISWDFALMLFFCIGAALVLFSYKKLPNSKQF